MEPMFCKIRTTAVQWVSPIAKDFRKQGQLSDASGEVLIILGHASTTLHAVTYEWFAVFSSLGIGWIDVRHTRSV